MRQLTIQVTKILGAVVAILIVVTIGFEVSNMRVMARSSSSLNEFCSNIPVGASQYEVSLLVQKKEGFRFTPIEDIALISLHTCHCSVRFTENKVSGVSKTICNG